MYIQSFLSHLQHEKRYSTHTIKSYQNDLEQFLEYLSFHYELNDLAKAHHLQIRSWVVQMITNGISEKTVNRKISTLRSFFNYQKKKGQVQSNPMSKVVAPKIGKKLPEYVNIADIDKLQSEGIFTNDFVGIRDQLIMELLYQTGMRRGELINLKLKDIDKSNKVIKVFGKGQKERLIPVNPVLLGLIDYYLTAYQSEFGQALIWNSSLIVTDKGKILYPKFVFNIVKHYLGMITTLKKRSPHILRHSFATHLSNNGAELNAIKSLLGHASLAATQVYTHNSIERLKNVYKNAHPKASLKT